MMLNPELSALCEKYQAQLMVDDAHGFGVLGKKGGGCAEYFQLTSKQLPILVGTLGKAFGTFGAFVVGSHALVETLIQFARPYIYTTALPPAVAAASHASLSLLQSEHWRREKLQQNICYFRAGAQSIGLSLLEPQRCIEEPQRFTEKPQSIIEESQLLLKETRSSMLEHSITSEALTPIQPVLLRSDEVVMHVAEQLRQQGLLVGAIRPPTVPEGTSRLRITLNACHNDSDIERLLFALKQAIPDEYLMSKT